MRTLIAMPRKPTKKKAAPTGARPRRRADQREETRETIRRAAFELFSTRGFDDTTTQAIAERAGVAHGTVFVHASDKADLLFLVMHDRLDKVVRDQFESMPPATEARLIDRLMHVFSALFRMYNEHPKMGAAFVKHQPSGTGPNAQRVNALTMAFLGRLAMLISESQARAEVASDLNPVLCAQNIFGLYFVALLTWLTGHLPDEEALDAMARASLSLQIRGFRPSPSLSG